jgi:peptidoglycan/xylan/chitin deacetylase (PgdA/CDA1 family)
MARRPLTPRGSRAIRPVNTERPMASVKRAARRALRSEAVGEAVRAIAALRGRGLVLVYHRVTQTEPSIPEVVPVVPSTLFRHQLETLADVGDIVPLETLLRDRDRHARPRFAITFDDDYVTHVADALPVLRALDARATFFLSGRALHRLGSYWFELLERLLGERGTDAVGRLLGSPTDRIDELIALCERDPTLHEVLADEAVDDPRHLDRSQIESLSDAGMAIGFHTLHHEVLIRLDDEGLDTAVTFGRSELETVVGRPIVHFAYPHWKADRRVADIVRNAGYDAAWTGHPRPMRRGDDRYLLGRWEPGRREVDDLLVETAIRLTRGGG